MRKGRSFEPDALAHLVRGIKEEYAIKRGYLLRMWPHAVGNRKEVLKQVLEIEGFKRNSSVRPYRTFLLDLSPSLDDLRKNLVPRWRTSLNRAERNRLSVVEGTNNELVSVFIRIEKECRKIKKFTTNMNYEAYRRIQNDLPEPLKMRFMVCEAQGEPVCVSAYSAIGDTGVYTLGATGEKGYGLNASYLLQWRMIQRLKESGVRYYDLGPFNPQLNPGVYRFKRGLAGKKGWEEKFLGEYDGCFNLRGRIAGLVSFRQTCMKRFEAFRYRRSVGREKRQEDSR